MRSSKEAMFSSTNIAIGYVMIAQRNGGEPSKEAQEALAGAVAGAEELRIEPLDQEGNPI